MSEETKHKARVIAYLALTTLFAFLCGFASGAVKADARHNGDASTLKQCQFDLGTYKAAEEQAKIALTRCQQAKGCKVSADGIKLGGKE